MTKTTIETSIGSVVIEVEHVRGPGAGWTSAMTVRDLGPPGPLEIPVYLSREDLRQLVAVLSTRLDG